MLNVFDVLLAITIAFTITFLAIPVIIKVAERKKLFDLPDERKIHQTPIHTLGGLGFFAGFIIACLITIQFSNAPEFQYFCAAAFVIFFLGLKDDILVISPIKKFIGQVLAAFLIIYKGEMQIKSMHGFLGIYELPEMFSLLLTYFTFIVIINSFNLIDGVDGNIIGFDPDLGLLTGFPSYYPLNIGSLAIDAGDDAKCAMLSNQSQNGVIRPQGAHCDIGSYEAPFEKK